ncbi:hypothetical protein Tco_1118660 [Tanacetum coccineum]
MHMQEGYNQEEMYISQSVFWQSLMSRFKEGDFPQLRINDIEDMLLLVVQNWLTNLLGDDVADFAIALRMFTRSLISEKGTHTLHTKTLKDSFMSTTTSGTVLAEEKLEQFGKERAHSMIKDINKLLKERRMMRSLEKFVAVESMELTSDCCKEQYDFVILCSYLKDSHDPVTSLHNLPSYCKVSQQTSSFISHPEITSFYQISHIRLVDIEKGQTSVDFNHNEDGNLLEPTSNNSIVGQSSWIRRILKGKDFYYSNTERLSRSDEVLKLKNLKKDALLKLFKLTYQERYEHVGLKVTSSQDGNVYKMADPL